MALYRTETAKLLFCLTYVYLTLPDGRSSIILSNPKICCNFRAFGYHWDVQSAQLRINIKSFSNAHSIPSSRFYAKYMPGMHLNFFQ